MKSGESPETMDKKRMPSAPPKGNGADCKRENGNGRNGKGGSTKDYGPRPRPDQRERRPYSQQSRQFDKRSRTREGCYFRQGEEVNEIHTENNAVPKFGNKKQNLNHLLNFSVSPRATECYGDDRRFYAQPSAGRRKRWGNSKSSIRYNKEQFLQANCQFVVKDDDYTVHSVDPDILVEWDNIEQIRMYSNDVPSCPICLYPPVAAKITRCGHIYCWRCMLHYLSLSEKNHWRKCPICYESIHQKDLKSVKALQMPTYQVGDEISMRLMKRSRENNYSMPAAQWQERNCKPLMLSDDVDLSFSKLLVATPEDVQREIIDVEKTALQTQLAEDGGSLEATYVTAALELLKERQVIVNMAKAAQESVYEKLEVLGKQDSTKPNSRPVSNVSTNAFAPLRKDIVEYSCAFSDEELQIGDSPEQSSPEATAAQRTISESSEEAVIAPESSPADMLLPSNIMSKTTADGEKVEISVDAAAEELVLPAPAENRGNVARSNEFFFYQASDGQQIYLHSVNARCLAYEYGSLENCPDIITAKIVEVEGISMNEELRGRLKYLNHLPLTCEFKVAELSLKSPTVSKKTILNFADDIEKRKRLRQKKQRDERRQLKKMQEDQFRRYEQDPEMRVLLTSHHYPECSSTIVKSEMPQLLGADQYVSPLLTAESTPVGSPTNADLHTDDTAQSSMSFAQMLRAGKTKEQTVEWPRTGGDVGGGARNRRYGSDDSDDEDRVPVPTYKSSFSNAIKSALDNYGKQPDTAGSAAADMRAGNGVPGAKKKKKKTKTLLFTTNMARNK